MVKREHEDESEDKGFRIVDRRRFTTSGDVRADAPPDAPPIEPVAPLPAPAKGGDNGKSHDPRQRSREPERVSKKGAAPAEPNRGAAPPSRSEAPAEASGIDFVAFAASLATNALAALGALPEAQSQGLPRSPELAREYIDILAMLKDKTRGNLTRDEEQALQQMLTELRLHYVEATRR